MEVNREKIWYILRFFFVKGENASQVTEIVNVVYGADTVTANYVLFWFRRFRSDIFDVKDAPHTVRPVIENVDKITEIIEVDRHVSSRSIAQKLKIDDKTVLNYLRKVGFKKKLDVWVPHQLTPKNMMGRISICEAKRNEIGPFLKRMVTEDEKWVTYDHIVRKRSWSKRGEAAQTVAKPGLRSLLSTTEPFEVSDRPEMAKIDQTKKYSVPSGQLQTTHVCSDSPETLGAWLGSFNASTI
ncbi:histone-lysine N-methyltransferase SETMAR [Trichonephila clavipes]|nr:histone-lysine N-methyltransferase SETMAR [Trichonephila clavipes]